MEKISNNITYAEATKSQEAIRKGIENKPTPTELSAMVNIATKVFEPIRLALGNKSLGISSFFRSAKVNKAIGGSITSQHCKGEAMDIDGDIFGNHKNSDIFNYIKDHLEFDQLIWEFGDKSEPAWVHVSLKLNGINRKQILRAIKKEGKTIYELI